MTRICQASSSSNTDIIMSNGIIQYIDQRIEWTNDVKGEREHNMKEQE